jgi:hypothetical protein
MLIKMSFSDSFPQAQSSQKLIYIFNFERLTRSPKIKYFATEQIEDEEEGKSGTTLEKRSSDLRAKALKMTTPRCIIQKLLASRDDLPVQRLVTRAYQAESEDISWSQRPLTPPLPAQAQEKILLFEMGVTVLSVVKPAHIHTGGYRYKYCTYE